MKLKHLFTLLIILNLLSCEVKEAGKIGGGTTPAISTDLQVDHFNIWVKDPEVAKKKLTDIGFTSVPDSLSDVHHGQGTAGRYFYFLNGYLELIFVYDQEELEGNSRINEHLDFTERARFEENGASPFSIALKVKDYDVEKITFDKVRYHQDWMGEDASIYSAKNSKLYLKEPSVFVVYPEIQSRQFETLADLKNIQDEYAFLRDLYRHPNGAKKITDIVISSAGVNLDTETMQAVNGIEGLAVKKGAAHLMELYFDDNIQGKSFDLRPELPLKIYY